MADLGVFTRYKSYGDIDAENQKNGLAAALLQAKIANTASGGSQPAAIQIANEFQKAREAGDTQRMNDLLIAAKSLDKGVTMDANGNATVLNGYAPAIGVIEQGKQTGKNISDLAYKPAIAGGEAASKFTQELKFATPINTARKVGDAAGEAQGAINTKAINAPAALSVLDQIEAPDANGLSLLDKATGSDLGAAGARFNKFVGKSTDATKANADLAVLGNTLVSNVPRMQGPQSDKDVQFYKDQAGRIADPSVPAGDKRAAIAAIRQLQMKYAQPESLDDVLSQPSLVGVDGNGNKMPKTPADARKQFEAKGMLSTPSGIKYRVVK